MVDEPLTELDSPVPAVYPSRRNVPTMTDFGTVSAPEKSEQPLIRLSKHMACHAEGRGSNSDR
jgi:hypothetical protein